MQSSVLPSQSIPTGVKGQPSIFQIRLKKESGLFPSWKSYIMMLAESGNQQLLAKLKNKKTQKFEDSLDLTSCRLSSKIVKIESNFCFGFIGPTNKKYLIAGRSQQETLEIYNQIQYLRKRIKLARSAPSKLEQSREQNDYLQERDERNSLSFEKESEERESASLQTPKKRSQEEEQECIEIRAREREDEEDLFKTAVLDVSPLEIEEPCFQEKQLTLSEPISKKEVSCLNSDEGFKLKYNFPEGRLLTAREQLIKVNLIVSTQLSVVDLLQSFFHFQLWNEKVRSYSLINRIEEGIYLVKLELQRKSIISRLRYCYMMVSTCRVQGHFILVFRSLEQEQFDTQIGYNWISMDLWVQAQASEADCKLLTVCSSLKNAKDFQIGLLFLEELKKYQLFLKTTGDLPRSILEWKGDKI